ncbi:MAG: phenylacetate--CoA ligase family protein [bacterium]
MPDWETVENWPRDEAELYQDQRIGQFISDIVYPNSPYYQELFEQEDLSPNDIHDTDDLQKLPFTTKQDLLPSDEQPDRYRDFILQPDEERMKWKPSNILRALFFGRDTVREEIEREFRPVFLTATTGRSAEPVAFLYSKYDMDNLSSWGSRLIDVFGGTTDMKGINMFPYAPHLAYWQSVFAALDFGILAHSTGGGKVRGTEGNIDLMDRMQPEILIGMPSYVYHILREGNKQGASFESLEKIILGGEAITPSGRKKMIEQARDGGAGSVNVQATYAFTEARVAWGECPGEPDQPTGYHYYPDVNYFELRDPETGERVPHEEGGELVYTPLDGRGSVVLRYRTGDLCESIQWGECPHCGRRLPRIMGPIQRVSKIEDLKLDKVKGTLVNFNNFQETLNGHEMVSEWQIELRKEDDDPMGLDELHLHVSYKEGIDEEQAKQQLREDIVEATEVSPNKIHSHSYEDMLERLGLETELKEERFLDNRPEEE